MTASLAELYGSAPFDTTARVLRFACSTLTRDATRIGANSVRTYPQQVRSMLPPGFLAQALQDRVPVRRAGRRTVLAHALALGTPPTLATIGALVARLALVHLNCASNAASPS